MSFIPGQDIFDQRSELNQPSKGWLALLTVVIAALIAVAFFRTFDGLFVGSTLISQAIVIGVGQVFVAQVILHRDDFRARYGDRAFSVAFRWLAIPGLTLIAVAVAHFAWIEGDRILPHEIVLIPFLYLLISGILLWVRAILAFGIDNLSLMYVFYPKESRLVNSNVYSVVRHPIYGAVLRIIFAIILWNGSAFALFASCIAPLALWLWLRWVEEPELIERFGKGYEDYRRRVPAFFNFDPRTWGILWRFLLRGK